MSDWHKGKHKRTKAQHSYCAFVADIQHCVHRLYGKAVFCAANAVNVHLELRGTAGVYCLCRIGFCRCGNDSHQTQRSVLPQHKNCQHGHGFDCHFDHANVFVGLHGNQKHRHLQCLFRNSRGIVYCTQCAVRFLCTQNKPCGKGKQRFCGGRHTNCCNERARQRENFARFQQSVRLLRLRSKT